MFLVVFIAFISSFRVIAVRNETTLPPLVWIRPNAEGIVQHWHQLNLLYFAMMKRCKRKIMLAPFLNNWHYPDVSKPINLCHYFEFPELVDCLSESAFSISQRLNCSIVSCSEHKWDCHTAAYSLEMCKSFEECGVRMTEEDVCTCNECLLSDMWTASNRSVYRDLKVVDMPISFTKNVKTLVKAVKSIMKFRDDNFTLVHWRRHGIYGTDLSVNNPNFHAEDLIKLIDERKTLPNVYIATNEVNSTDLNVLRSYGYRLSGEYAKLLSLSTVETFFVELQLAIDSADYVHWGGSTINSFIDIAKKQRIKN